MSKLILPCFRFMMLLTLLLGPDTASAENISLQATPLLMVEEASSDIDWASGTIRATGIGMAPVGFSNPTVRREMARRAALSDGERKLVKAVAEIRLGTDSTIRSRMGRGNFTKRIEGYVKGYRIVGERDFEDGRTEVDLELPLTGQQGLSRYLFD